MTQAPTTTTGPLLFPATTPPLYRFSVEKYHEMIEFGVLTPADRVELIDGVIVDMSPIGPPHAVVVRRTDHRILTPMLPVDWHVRSQQPVTFSTSEPQPDLAVVRGDDEDYTTHHPRPKEIGLLIEVADTTLIADRNKAKIYAAEGISAYWIIDLVNRKLEVYGNAFAPVGAHVASYASKDILDETMEVEFELEGAEIGRIPVARMLPT